MKSKVSSILEIIGLICIPAMLLFFLLMMGYLVFLKTGVIRNVYLQVILVYGIPILFSLWIFPMIILKYLPKDIGLCRNKKTYQDLLAVLGICFLLFLFFYKKHIDDMEGAYILQFVFVGIGEEVFFRAIIFERIKSICNSSVTAVIVVAIIFGCLFHLDGGVAALVLIRVPLSVLFSFIYIKTGSLSIPIILHALYNIMV